MLWPGLLTDRAPEHIRSVLDRLWEEQTLCVREIPGATLLLKSLKEMGLKLGVVSNTWHPLYVGFCRNCPELNGLLDYTFLSYRMGCKKPAAGILSERVARNGGETSRLLDGGG